MVGGTGIGVNLNLTHYWASRTFRSVDLQTSRDCMVLDTLLALKKAARLEIAQILFPVMRKFAPPVRTRPLLHPALLHASFPPMYTF